jgi:signal peptidase I
MSRLLSEEEPHQQTMHSPRKPARRSGPERPRPNWLSELFDWIRTLGIAVVLVVLVNLFLFNLSKVEGHSMEPTLEPHEWLFINKIGYRLGNPERGDVVILKDPSTDAENSGKYLVKRVVGIPGDTIEVRGGQLYVNGILQVEAYTDATIEDEDYGPAVVEEERYFIMGDNRHAGASKDSRLFGTVPGTLIKGEAEFVLWPITKWNKL